MKERITREEWGKLWVAKINDWTVAVGADQHVLGWLNIFPPRKFEGSLVHLTDDELIELKKIGVFLEEILQEAFQADWFNYSQEGNVVKSIHVHLKPRYSSPKEFFGHIFTDEGWGHPIKYLPVEQLADKEIVFQIVAKLRDVLTHKSAPGLNIEVFST